MSQAREVRVGKLRIGPGSLFWQFSRSSGPGGQHVNRTSSRAELRYPLLSARDLPEPVRQRLVDLVRPRLTHAGELILTSQRHRDQSRNVADCLAKLTALVARAAVEPRMRRATKPTRAAATRRLESKRRRSQIKHLRGSPRE
jgi:ribosome-associated protein